MWTPEVPAWTVMLALRAWTQVRSLAGSGFRRSRSGPGGQAASGALLQPRRRLGEPVRDLSQRANRGLDLLQIRIARVQADAAPVPPGGREDRAGRDADASPERLLVQLQRIDAGRHLHPEDGAALGPGHARSLGEARGDDVAHVVHLLGQLAAERP